MTAGRRPATDGDDRRPRRAHEENTGDRAGVPPADLDAAIARVLMAGTYIGVALIAAGVALMLARGISPLDPPPPLAAGDIPAAAAAIRPEALLAVGIVGIILTPSARVTASLVGYVRDGERTMALISLAILGVIALSVVLAIGLQGA
jgi:uncharacterized membrane protein